MSVDSSTLFPVNSPSNIEKVYVDEEDDEDDSETEFGFTFVLQLASKQHEHSRTVYTFLEFLGDIGGLNDAFNLFIQPLVSLILPSLLTRSILVEGNFKYDSFRDNDNNSSRNEVSKR